MAQQPRNIIVFTVLTSAMIAFVTNGEWEKGELSEHKIYFENEDLFYNINKK